MSTFSASAISATSTVTVTVTRLFERIFSLKYLPHLPGSRNESHALLLQILQRCKGHQQGNRWGHQQGHRRGQHGFEHRQGRQGHQGLEQPQGLALAAVRVAVGLTLKATALQRIN